jgi:hypothetical protein
MAKTSPSAPMRRSVAASHNAVVGEKKRGRPAGSFGPKRLAEIEEGRRTEEQRKEEEVASRLRDIKLQKAIIESDKLQEQLKLLA